MALFDCNGLNVFIQAGLIFEFGSGFKALVIVDK